MRSIPTFVSVIALLWCSAMVLRLSGTWVIPAYVICQSLFALVGFWGLQKNATDSPWYWAFYLPTFFAVLLLAVIVAIKFVVVYPVGLGLIVLFGSLVSAVAACSVTYYQLLKMFRADVPIGQAVLCIQAGILCFCGSATLLTLAEPMSPAMHSTALALSIFWLSIGSLLFAYLLGIQRTFGLWAGLNLWLPSFLAIACFGWLAFSLSGLQLEAGRQAVGSDHVQVVEVQ